MNTVVDVELTNRCNTVCTFCPRDKTPDQGFMHFKTFEKSLARILEFDGSSQITFCGLGEPLLHPQIIDCLQYATTKGLRSSMTTNASLLSEHLSRQLVQAGLKSLTVSMSGIDDVYREIHRLDFSKVRKNLDMFLELAGNQCELVISITKCDHNRNELEALKSYWKNFGVNTIFVLGCANRGGALDLGFSFVDNKKYTEHAEEILAAAEIPSICPVPFVYLFIGWNGNYYFCCHDYRKLHPLGTVFDYSFEDIQIKKQKVLESKPKVCGNCDINRVNIVREYLFRIENGSATEDDLSRAISEIKEGTFLGLENS